MIETERETGMLAFGRGIRFPICLCVCAAAGCSYWETHAMYGSRARGRTKEMSICLYTILLADLWMLLFKWFPVHFPVFRIFIMERQMVPGLFVQSLCTCIYLYGIAALWSRTWEEDEIATLWIRHDEVSAAHTSARTSHTECQLRRNNNRLFNSQLWMVGCVCFLSFCYWPRFACEPRFLANTTHGTIVKIYFSSEWNLHFFCGVLIPCHDRGCKRKPMLYAHTFQFQLFFDYFDLILFVYPNRVCNK